jgi:serine/threonine-protein kinase
MSQYEGKSIGEYRLIETIDQTRNTLVLKAFQPSKDRYVALTVLKPSAARDAAVARRFTQAAQLAAQVQHPNILPVYDSGRAEGVLYRASALAEGGTLRDSLAAFREPNLALELFRQLVDALEYLHGQGYVHGNLRSSNVYLDAQRRPLISDFGVTRPHGGEPDAYASPEQVQGGVVDRRADVYALGVLLYEVLVGETPPPGVVVSPRARRPDLSEAIERVILRSTAQNPDHRFQSAAEFQSTLQGAVQAPPSPTPEPAPAPAPAAAPAPGVTQSVQVDQPKGTNWAAIILGALLVVVSIAAAWLLITRLMEGQEGEIPPTQPPVEVTVEVTVEIPTQPTEEPEQPPTEEPEQPPTEEPEQPPTEEPEQPPPEQPEQPPPEQPEQLPEPPPEASEDGQPGLCSSLGLAGGAAILAGTISYRRRKPGKRRAKANLV